MPYALCKSEYVSTHSADDMCARTTEFKYALLIKYNLLKILTQIGTKNAYDRIAHRISTAPVQLSRVVNEKNEFQCEPEKNANCILQKKKKNYSNKIWTSQIDRKVEWEVSGVRCVELMSLSYHRYDADSPNKYSFDH